MKTIANKPFNKTKGIKKALPVFLLLSFFAIAPVTHADDCTKMESEVDKTVCRDIWLKKLDADMRFYYRHLLHTSSNEHLQHLMDAQSHWASEKSRRCEHADNFACLNETYRQRVHELKAQYYLSRVLPKDKDVQRMCGELASLTPEERQYFGEPLSKEQVSSQYVVDVNNDGIYEKPRQCVGATLHEPCVAYEMPNGKKLSMTPIGFEWQSYWTYGLSHFSWKGDWYRLHAYDKGFEEPAYVSYVTDDNKEYVVCEFEPGHGETMTASIRHYR